MRFLAFITGAVLFLGVVSIGILIFFNSSPPYIFSSENDRDSGVAFEVRNGESAMSVGQRLEEAGLIKSRYFWYLLFRIESSPVKTGVYRLDPPMTQLEIRSILVEGRQILIRVTIPEGGTLRKTAAILEDAGICPAADFLEAAASPELISRFRVPGKTLEGYLYPDTYLFPASFSAARAARIMAENFYSRLAEIYPEALSFSPEELFRRVIMASIVEREYRVPDEAPLMAGVFYNRLRIGMALQSCATVGYVITEIQGRPHPEVLYDRDTEIRDPYNTYQRPGLPPGPICSPGALALMASFEHKESDYLYFRLVEASTGRHYFSRTLDDHIRAGLLYVKGR